MRVLVCGGRDYAKVERLRAGMDRIHVWVGITVLIHGECPQGGADQLAGEWARDARIVVEPYPMEPGEGGFARNHRMLVASRPMLVVHFPGGNGTKHMVRIAHEAGVRTYGGLTSR